MQVWGKCMGRETKGRNMQYSLDPPSRKLHVKKTSLSPQPQRLKIKPWLNSRHVLKLDTYGGDGVGGWVLLEAEE